MSRTVVVAVVGALAVAVGALLGNAERVQVDVPMVSAPPTSPALIDVHVAGWVMSPGVVQISEGSIVADAIEAAGGFRHGAQTYTVNLAAPVMAGDQIFIAGPDSEPEGAADNGVLSINRATASDLETLPGVGPVLAERIVAYRDEHGPFRVVEDLLDVTGIGESKLASIRDLIRVP